MAQRTRNPRETFRNSTRLTPERRDAQPEGRLAGTPDVGFAVETLRGSQSVDGLLLATSKLRGVDDIEDLSQYRGYLYLTADTNNTLVSGGSDEGEEGKLLVYLYNEGELDTISIEAQSKTSGVIDNVSGTPGRSPSLKFVLKSAGTGATETIQFRAQKYTSSNRKGWADATRAVLKGLQHIPELILDYTTSATDVDDYQQLDSSFFVPACRASNLSFAVPNASFTRIPATTTSTADTFDNDALVGAGGVITASRDGFWRVGGHVVFPTNAAASIQIQVVKNGSNRQARIDQNGGAGDDHMTIDTLVELEAGDTAEVQVFHNDGAQLTGVEGYIWAHFVSDE